jgi:putative ABC transport system ATP-binding protein
MATPLLTQSVTKIYGSDSGAVKAVDEVSIRVQSGEFAALVGPSGSGKTTLLAMMAGLLEPSGGCVVIDGDELCAMSEAQRAQFRRQKVGFTFQANNLVPYLTAQENVELMLRLNGKLNRAGQDRAKELLIRLGLGDRLRNLPRQLSGGQQQRVAIARALIHDPSVVLADEPTASLDTERAYQVIETFASLIHEQNRAGIMVTHDLRLCQYVDKVIKMVDGKVQQVIVERQEIDAMAQSRRSESQPAADVKGVSGSGMSWSDRRNGQQLIPLPAL